MTADQHPATSSFTVRLLLQVDGVGRDVYDALAVEHVATEGYGAGRVIAVSQVDAASDIDAVVEARERLRRAGAPEPICIVAVKRSNQFG